MSTVKRLKDAKKKRKQARKDMYDKPKGSRHRLKRLIARLNALIKRLRKKKNKPDDIKIKQVPLGSTGPMAGGGHKIVWHTTEGATASGALGAYKASGAYPHYTLAEDGTAWQHLPHSQYATALQHVFGPETNRANAIQVEIVGFAGSSGNWSDGRYEQIAALARHIEKSFNVRRDAKVSFDNPSRLSPDGFVSYQGHCGHAHVPGNSHYDPGTGFKIGKVL
jgi:hypothetical protein